MQQQQSKHLHDQQQAAPATDLEHGHHVMEEMVAGMQEAMLPHCQRLYEAVEARERALKRLQMVERAVMEQNKRIQQRVQKKCEAVSKVGMTVQGISAAAMTLPAASSPRSA